MSLRGIDKITLYDIGFVVCRDAQFRQAPSLQGLFPDVVDKIVEMFGKSDVTWIINRDGKDFTVSLDDWLSFGRKLKGKVIETKPADINEIKIIGCPKERLDEV